LRASLLHELINRGGVLIGVAPPFVSADVVEFFGLLGFDWILLDGEHGPVGVESCHSLIRAADAVGLATVVRIPANEPWLVLTYVESGADAILVPHIADAAAAEHLVSMGYPGGFDNPTVRAEVHDAATRLSQARKTVATVVTDTARPLPRSTQACD
jgi:2-keto-3-deoxy-L-rhamnonate aldolase RhmA